MSAQRPPMPDEPGGSCDWGRCNRNFYEWRWADDLQEWLPVCGLHRDRKNEPDEPEMPTPAAGQQWRSTAFAPNNPEGRVDVLAAVQTGSFGLVVVEHLVRGGRDALAAMPVEAFLQRRKYVGAR